MVVFQAGPPDFDRDGFVRKISKAAAADEKRWRCTAPAIELLSVFFGFIQEASS